MPPRKGQRLGEKKVGKKSGPPGTSPISGFEPPKDTRWKPGQSGNPSGLGGGMNITQALQRIQKMTAAEIEAFRRRDDLIGVEVIALRWFDRLCALEVKGNAAQLLVQAQDRTEGAVKRTHVLEGGLSPVTDPAELARRLAADAAPGTPAAPEA